MKKYNLIVAHHRAFALSMGSKYKKIIVTLLI